MLRIARWTVAHRWIVVVSWIVAVVIVSGISSSVGGMRKAENFTLPNTGTQRAQDLLKSSFPAQAGDTDEIVFHSRTGKLTDPSARGAVTAIVAGVARLAHVTGVVSPYSGARSISADGTIGFATVSFDKRANELPKAAINRVIDTAQAGRSPALQVELGGQAIEQAQQQSLGFATAVGIGAAIVILLVSFGSLVAMGLPIATALFGLGAGVGLIGVASQIIDMPDFASELALMIGLGVGIDYALFIVTRFRENYRANGGDVNAAVEQAMNTAGRAVMFAGVTVVIALLGMLALGVSLLNGAAIASALGVVLVLAASLTLLPALMSLVGRRVGELGRRQRARTAAGPTVWLRWVTQIQRRPAIAAVTATALMLLLAAPALGLRLGSSDAGNDPASKTTRKAYDLIARGFGAGYNGPLQVAMRLPRAHDDAAIAQVSAALRGTPGVASVAAPRLNGSGTTASILAFPISAPQSAQTTDLVQHLRSAVMPPLERATGAAVYVGGATAAQVDFAHVLSRKMPLFIGVVIALSALLLMVVFRSLAIPLQAAAMNLLSIGASIGVVQAIFERGWLGGSPGPIDSFIPVMVFAIVFGLSMDYEVFLVSRVHEEWQARGDASFAVREGLARTGRVITAAAAVMVAVFVSFAIGGNRVLTMFGVAMATAVFLDAVVVRLVLLPAVLELLGRRTWAFPRWLDRRLPRLAIEPHDTHEPGAPATAIPAFEGAS